MSINPLLKHGFWRVFYIRRGVSATIIDSAEAVPFLRVIHPFGVTLPMNEAGLMKPRLTLQDFDWCIFHEDITTKLFIVYICPYAICHCTKRLSPYRPTHTHCLGMGQNLWLPDDWGNHKPFSPAMTVPGSHWQHRWPLEAEPWIFLLCLGCA